MPADIRNGDFVEHAARGGLAQRFQVGVLARDSILAQAGDARAFPADALDVPERALAILELDLGLY